MNLGQRNLSQVQLAQRSQRNLQEDIELHDQFCKLYELAQAYRIHYYCIRVLNLTVVLGTQQ